MPASIFSGDGVKILKDKLKFKTTGSIAWDATNGCPSYPSDIANVTNQIGQETHVRVFNNTGSIIADGSAVYVSGSNAGTGLPEVSLALATGYPNSRVLGLVTAAIGIGATGIVTRFGVVNNLNTNAYTAGDVLYLSETVAGAYTITHPVDGSFPARIGIVVVKSATVGSILVNPNAEENTVESTERTGWSSMYGPAALSFVDGALGATRTLTLTPTIGSTFHFYQNGVKYTKATDSFKIADTEGLHFIYYNLGVLAEIINPTDAQIDTAIRTNPLVAYVYWDATAKAHNFLGKELHGINMAKDTHAYLHFAFGARYLNGLALNTFVADGSGALATNIQFGVDAGAIVDEDIYFPTIAIASTVGLPIYYLLGTTAAPTLRKATNAGYSAIATGTGRIAYNFLTGGNWTLAEVANTDFCLYHIFCIGENTQSLRVVAIMGQSTYTSVANARAGATTEIAGIQLIPGFPKEMKSLGTVIYETNNSYSNALKARIRTIAVGINYQDWRAVTTTGGTVAGGAVPTVFNDSTFQIFDNTDVTKTFQFEASGITTANNRVITVPDRNIILNDVRTTTTTNLTGFLKGDGANVSSVDINVTPDYILNSTFDTATTGWAAYADAAAATPVDGTGGSPTVTITRNTTTPLRGAGDGLITKDASNRQGEGVSYDFTIDPADFSKVLQVSFNYKTSANYSYANGDVAIFMYSRDGAALVPITPNSLDGSGRFVGQFQTDATPNNDYRLIFHVATVNASAWTMNIDDVQVGPVNITYGAPVTDWINYTPTVAGYGTGTPGSISAKYRRVGDSMEISGRFSVSSGTGTAAVTYSLPVGYSMDTTKYSANDNTFGSGYSFNLDNGGVNRGGISVIPSSTTLLKFIYGAQTPTNSTFYGTLTGETFSNASSTVAFFAVIPIAGWSSNVVMSSDAGNRVVACRVKGDAASASANQPIIFPTIDFDTTASYNPTTGRYLVSTGGYYRVYGYIESANNAASLYAYVNAVFVIQGGITDSNGEGTFNCLLKCNAGDFIDLRSSATLDANNVSNLNIELVSSPQTIAASESVGCDSYLTGNQTGVNTNNTFVKLNINTVAKDTHAAFNVSTYRYVAPISGFYSIIGSVYTDPTNILANYYQLVIRINGVTVFGGPYQKQVASSAFVIPVSAIKYLNPGDYVELFLYGAGDNSTSTITVIGSSSGTVLQIARLS